MYAVTQCHGSLSSSLGTNRERAHYQQGKGVGRARSKKERKRGPSRRDKPFSVYFCSLPVNVWPVPSSLFPLPSSLFSLLLSRAQLFNFSQSPTNDARSIYDPVNSFYSTVKSAWDERKARTRPGWSSGFNANAALDATPRVAAQLLYYPLWQQRESERGWDAPYSAFGAKERREVSLIRLGPGCAVKVIRQ